MYRVPKKTTKTTRDFCKKCKYYKGVGLNKCKCEAPNACFKTVFDPRYHYCIQYRSLNDMSEFDRNEFFEKARKKENERRYYSYIRANFPKKKASEIIKYYKKTGEMMDLAQMSPIIQAIKQKEKQ